MKSSRSESADTQTSTILVLFASVIAALSSFLLFGLQPLAVTDIGPWHSPAIVLHFFQWTYLVGIILTAVSSGLAPGSDLRLTAIVFLPVAAYTVYMAIPDGPQRLGHLAPIAVWLACSSTIMVRALGRMQPTQRSRTYSIFACSNAGALFGVLVWMHPDQHTLSDVSWLIVGAILLIIGVNLAVVVRIHSVGHGRPNNFKARSVQRVCGYAVVIWFALAMCASAAMMHTQKLFAAIDTSESATTATAAGRTALPLMIFLLSYVVGWSHEALAWRVRNQRWLWHVLACGLIAALTIKLDPSKTFASLALYVYCAACVEMLRRSAPLPANATLFQIIQAAGGAFGGWLVLLI